MRTLFASMIVLTGMLSGCKNEPIPALHCTILNSDFQDFVYTANGYLLAYNNFDKNANHFKLMVKSDRSKSAMQPVFPLSLRDSLFAANLIYAHVGKEGVSWLLFDKSEVKKNAPKRYKLIKYDLLRRVTEKSYFLLPVSGRDFSSISDLQIDENRDIIIYIDNKHGDVVSLNIKDGTFKSFSFPSNEPGFASKLLSIPSTGSKSTSTFKIALNLNNSTLYFINKEEGTLYSVLENYVVEKPFYNKDIQTQIAVDEKGLKDVVDIDFDYKSRPIIATSRSIYLVRNGDKTPLVKNFKYGDIMSVSYANNKVYFSVRSKNITIYSIDIAK